MKGRQCEWRRGHRRVDVRHDKGRTDRFAVEELSPCIEKAAIVENLFRASGSPLIAQLPRNHTRQVSPKDAIGKYPAIVR
jgi:hypothetical protein